MRRRFVRLKLLELEQREQPSAATVTMSGTTLIVTADSLGGLLDIYQNGSSIIVSSRGNVIGTYDATGVTSLTVNGSPASDIIRIDNSVTLPTTIDGKGGMDKISGGGGQSTITDTNDNDLIVGGLQNNTINISPGGDVVYKTYPGDTVATSSVTQVLAETNFAPISPETPGLPQQTMTTTDVSELLDRAAASSSANNAIIAIVDRNGRILGVRVESGVSTDITSDPEKLVFAIDGAVAEARTAAFFANDQAPLTSRTVENLSETTITEREVDSDPSITDPNSTLRGPGFVAPVGINGHFPADVPDTPQVDLFDIEASNRDSIYAPGPDGILGTADDVLLPERFNDDPAYVPDGQELYPPESYGIESGLSPRTANGIPIAESRGIGTLPGGVPLYKSNADGSDPELVGGIGVFFPGTTGYATEENSSLSSTYDPSKPDLSLEAEFMAVAASGGIKGILPVGTLPGGAVLPTGYGIPAAIADPIYLNGIQLNIIGTNGLANGLNQIRADIANGTYGVGNPNDSINVNGHENMIIDAATNTYLEAGKPAPDGWLVLPHAGVGITQAQVTQLIEQGIAQAELTRAAIRNPMGQRTQMVFAVADKDGNIVGLYRMPDATVFSIDVAVAKARNVSYYADSSELQPEDELSGVAPGTAFTNRTFGYLANPRFPTGIDGSPPGPFSQLNDPGIDPNTGLETGPPLPASDYTSVLGHDAFNPGTNFHDPFDLDNQNGIIFFPGSVPIYANGVLIGGFGVSGDGVTEDDVVTYGGAAGYTPPSNVQTADDVVYQGIRLPYQEFTRNPDG